MDIGRFRIDNEVDVIAFDCNCGHRIMVDGGHLDQFFSAREYVSVYCPRCKKAYNVHRNKISAKLSEDY